MEPNQSARIKEAIQSYSEAIQSQRRLQLKVLANPGTNLSFEEVTEYLKAVAQEREAEEDICKLFASPE